MNNMTQQQAAEHGSLLLGLAFGFLMEREDSKMFFFFYGIAMGMFHEYNIEIVIHNDKEY